MIQCGKERLDRLAMSADLPDLTLFDCAGIECPGDDGQRRLDEGLGQGRGTDAGTPTSCARAQVAVAGLQERERHGPGGLGAQDARAE